MTINFRYLNEVYRSVGVRIVLGFGAGATALANVPIEAGAQFDLSKALVVLGAVGLWVGSELKTIKISADLHDIALRQKFRDSLSQSRGLLYDHDFGNSFSASQLTDLGTISDTWHGPDFTFMNKKVQSSFSELLENIRAFTTHIAFNAGPTPAGGLTTFRLRNEDEWNLSSATVANIAKANKMANALRQEIDNFERLCVSEIGSLKEGQVRLGGNSGTN